MITLNLPTDTTRTIIPDPPSLARREFLTPIPDLPGEFLLVLDNTSLEKIKRCHKSAEFYLILGREAHAKNAALTFGGAIHEGIESFLLGESIDVQNQKIVSYFTNNPAPSDDYRTVQNALEVLKHYRRRSDPLLHPDYEWEIQSDSRGPIIERAFELPLDVLEGEWTWQGQEVRKIHIAWSGRIDLIAQVNQRVRVVDHKTSSIDGDQFIQSFQLSSQTIGYLWAARQIWPELNVNGFCLNCIRFKRPTGSCGIAERGPRGGDPALAFFRAYYDYEDQRIARWHNDTVLLIEDFLHSLSRQSFPMNDRHCFDKFGVCPYFNVCVIDNESMGRNLVLSDAFKPVTWNPVAGR